MGNSITRKMVVMMVVGRRWWVVEGYASSGNKRHSFLLTW